MKIHLADLVCADSGHWQLLRPDQGPESARAQLRIPLELCPDGNWVLTGRDQGVLRAMFDSPPGNVPYGLARLVDTRIAQLQRDQALPTPLPPSESGAIEFESRHWPALNALKSVIARCRLAFHEPPLAMSERVTRAAPTSLAGLMRSAGKGAWVKAFLDVCPACVRTLVELPLLSMRSSSQDDELVLLILDPIRELESRPEELVEDLAEHVCVYIDTRGAAHVTRTGWTFFGHHAFPLESAITGVEDCSIHQLLERLPEVISTLVGQLLDAALPAIIEQGLSVTSFRRGAKAASDMAIRRLRPLVAQVRERAAERIFPFDGAPRRCSYSAYFAGHSDAVIRERRLQGRKCMPLLVDCLAAGDHPLTAAALDAAEPLIDTLAAELAVPHWVASRLARLDVGDASIDEASHFGLRDLAEILEVIGPDSPLAKLRGPSLWTALTSLTWLMHPSHHDQGLHLFSHASQDKRLLLQLIGREKQLVYPPRSAEATSLVMYDIAQPVMADTVRICWYLCVLRETLRTYLQHEGLHPQELVEDVEAGLAAWTYRLRTSHLVDTARQATALLQRCFENALPTAIRNTLAQETHQIISPYLCSKTGVEVTHLVSKYALEMEGRKMAHCIGSYWARMADHSIYVFALNDLASEKRATLCVAKDESGAWSVEEVRLHRNAEVNGGPLLEAAVCVCDRLNASCQASDEEETAGELHTFVRLNHEDFAMQHLPADIRQQLLALLPGTGPLHHRVEHFVEVGRRARQRVQRAKM